MTRLILIALVLCSTLVAADRRSIMRSYRNVVSGNGPVGIDVSASTNVSTGTTITLPLSSANPNRLLLVGIGGYQNTRVLNSVTHNGDALTLLYFTNHYDGTHGFLYVYYKVAPATSGNIVATYDDSLPLLNALIGVILTNVNQSTPIGTFASTYIANASAAAGVSNTVTTATGDMAIDFTQAYSHNGTFTTQFQTELTNSFQSGNGGQRCSYSTSVGSVQLGWTNSQLQAWSQIALPVKSR